MPQPGRSKPRANAPHPRLWKAYRANAVCYTVSILSYRTAGRVHLGNIWNKQDVSAALEATLRSWMPWVHEEIVESAEGKNVTEWCKKRECWTLIQSLHLDLAPGFEEELAEGVPLPNVGQFREKKGSARRELTAEERDRQARTMRLEPNDWLAMGGAGRQVALPRRCARPQSSDRELDLPVLMSCDAH